MRLLPVEGDQNTSSEPETALGMASDSTVPAVSCLAYKLLLKVVLMVVNAVLMPAASECMPATALKPIIATVNAYSARS